MLECYLGGENLSHGEQGPAEEVGGHLAWNNTQQQMRVCPLEPVAGG
jgi:hypothetical protein